MNTKPDHYTPCTNSQEVQAILTEALRNPDIMTQEKIIRVLEYIYFLTPINHRPEDFVVAASEATKHF